jgi:hypothetical protein
MDAVFTWSLPGLTNTVIALGFTAFFIVLCPILMGWKEEYQDDEILVSLSKIQLDVRSA